MDSNIDGAEAGRTGPIPAEAYGALRQVVDPELGLNVVDLGLVLSLERRGGVLELDYQLTAEGCPVASIIEESMRAVLEALPGVAEVRMRRIADPPWGPERITPEGRAALGLA